MFKKEHFKVILPCYRVSAQPLQAQAAGRFAYASGSAVDGGCPGRSRTWCFTISPVAAWPTCEPTGVATCFVNCGNPDCYHNAELDVSGLPDNLTFGSCNGGCSAPCAIIAAPDVGPSLAASWLIGPAPSKDPIILPDGRTVRDAADLHHKPYRRQSRI